ncbi:ATP-dependent DNA ligase [Actinomycetospora flava]|uniref:DNA ligase (ATP) n=1 Tax=Actinomycetospora flava TaxID=3129232 RepID=A0ABU8M801_9PSEU
MTDVATLATGLAGPAVGTSAGEASPGRPMLASAGDVPRGVGWAFEFVWDGLRCLARTDTDGLRLVTDAGRDVTSHFPELGVSAPWTSTEGLVLDGVVVALDGVGRPSAGKLRRRHRVAHPSEILQAQVPVSYYVFDVLEVAGASTRRLPYRQRRELLAELDLSGSRVVIPPFFTGVAAEAVIDTARRYGLDGVVAKRLESTYQVGRRSRSWIETAVRRTQDVVVGGWIPARGRPGTVGALLVGVPGETGLSYSGRVVTGVTAAARRELDGVLTALERPASPFATALPEGESGAVHWLAPRLVGQVEHRRWTATGLLERPTWQGLRSAHPATVEAPVLSAPVVDTDLELDDLEIAESPGTTARASRRTPATPADVVAVPSAEDVESALRSRFSAHFVHNTLTAIASYVRTDPGRARELLTEFADFTRYSFRSGGELTTVGDELHNAERYLTLEQARFGQRLLAEVAVAPEVRGVLVPPFVVAPLVENAVRHGIEPVPGGGKVSVFAAGSGSDCVITVSDDGAGMGPEATRSASQVDRRHGGIAEVSRRLHATFGSQCDVHVDTRPGVGTAVRLRLPAITASATEPSRVLVG